MHRPKISVIIASVNGLPYINECLTALEKQHSKIDAEVIVANRCKDGTPDYIRKKFPRVKLLNFSRLLSIPELRANGIFHATGDIIAITEDHCIPREDWYHEILKAHESEYAVVGGAVENGSNTRIVDWAVYLCEYSGVMSPIPYGEAEWIAGNNASYKRWVLEKIDESVRKNYWEFFLHREMKKAGLRFLSVPTIVVCHKKEFGFLYFISQRYHYSRSFAGMRIVGSSLLKRIIYILSTPFLPPSLILRILQQVLNKRRYIKEFLLSLPLLIIFMVSYACGEFAGYVFGPGNSSVKVE